MKEKDYNEVLLSNKEWWTVDEGMLFPSIKCPKDIAIKWLLQNIESGKSVIIDLEEKVYKQRLPLFDFSKIGGSLSTELVSSSLKKKYIAR